MEVLAALPKGATALMAVPGITMQIATGAGAAFQESYVLGIRYVFMNRSRVLSYTNKITEFVRLCRLVLVDWV